MWPLVSYTKDSASILQFIVDDAPPTKNVTLWLGSHAARNMIWGGTSHAAHGTSLKDAR